MFHIPYLSSIMVRLTSLKANGGVMKKIIKLKLEQLGSTVTDTKFNNVLGCPICNRGQEDSHTTLYDDGGITCHSTGINWNAKKVAIELGAETPESAMHNYFRDGSKNAEMGRKYLEDRALDFDLCSKLGIGYSIEDKRITVPYILNGTLFGGTSRATWDCKSKYKSIEYKGGVKMPFNADALLEHKVIVITEGWADAISAMQCTIPQDLGVIALNGLNASKLIEIIKDYSLHFDTIVIMLDGDLPAQNVILPMVEKLSEYASWIGAFNLPKGKDVNDMLQDGTLDALTSNDLYILDTLKKIKRDQLGF